MDRISLKEMKLFGYTGCLPEEKKNGQYFYVSIDMFVKFIPGAVSDELSGTVNYAEVYEIAKKIVENSGFDLIEHLAHEIGREVIASYDLVDAVKVTARKPDAPVDGVFESMETEINIKRREAVIGFGGNIGDRKETIRQAIRAIEDNPAIEVVRISSLYETEPVGYDDQPVAHGIVQRAYFLVDDGHKVQDVIVDEVFQTVEFRTVHSSISSSVPSEGL